MLPLQNTLIHWGVLAVGTEYSPLPGRVLLLIRLLFTAYSPDSCFGNFYAEIARATCQPGTALRPLCIFIRSFYRTPMLNIYKNFKREKAKSKIARFLSIAKARGIRAMF